MNGIGSWWALSSSSSVSPTIGSPRSSTSPIRSPARRTPRHLTKPAFQASSVISLPSGSNQEMSLMSEPRIGRPWKNLPPLEDRLLAARCAITLLDELQELLLARRPGPS